ncbi:IQ domain-containing protein IQM2-like isoform X2 [Phragmites australis]|uniref:IQ domain-containing protein IQM2-like isoform X2 n=1 Tax=Phragmites australis TaxID=29695 RepID=UPI002D792608|nr:IQ domain-containing protein IQM2-like isoform X2 [Phragmites australis]
MGLSISYPPDDYLPEDEEDTDRLFVRSLSFDNLSTLETLESPPAMLDSLTSKRLIIRGSLSFKKKEGDPYQVETTISMVSPKPDKETSNHKSAGLPRCGPMENLPPDSPVIGMVSPKHQAAAIRVQKVYKSLRTRRQLADCAILVEQRWWKLLDFALLKRSSVSFFEVEKPESALSRWSRARMRAAKVGKGLSKDEKAQKLALQHWLEAIDPRHRYGHNLHYYYQHWLHCESKQPFFYWLDIGEGKEVNIEGHCPRWKLLQQCIRYLGPKEREFYETIVEDGKMMYKLSRKIVDTSEGPRDSKWIFVLSTTRVLYIGKKNKGTFQHSSFLAGGATSAAGRLIVENGILKAVWPHSGHYRPTEANFREFMNFLKKRNVDLTNVKLSPSEGEEDDWLRLRSGLPHVDLTEGRNPEKQEDTKSQHPHPDEDKATTTTKPATSPSTSGETTTTASASTPVMKRSSSGNRLQRKRPPSLRVNKSRLGKGTAEHGAGAFGDCLDFCKENLFRGGEGEVMVVPQEMILHRINSKMALHSYQLGNQLSFRWTTGAGPRIGCVRDYPPELQFRSLEQVSLSPRGGAGPARYGTPWHSPCAPLVSPTPGGLGSPLYGVAGTPTSRLQHGAA